MNKLQELHEAMSTCVICDLCNTRTQVVNGHGPHNAHVMLIGEAPGADEDYAGEPFVGRAGQKLDNMLKYTGLSRDDVYITNSILCRPPNNRNPNQDELRACRWRLLEEIKLVNPEIIIVLGKIALEQLMGEQIKASLATFFSNDLQPFLLDDESYVDMIVTYHPSYHLRSPDRAYKMTLPHWTALKNWYENNTQRSQ